jgi:excisionase family DNA binding protein
VRPTGGVGGAGIPKRAIPFVASGVLARFGRKPERSMTDTNTQDRLLTYTEVAKRLRVARGTVYRLVSCGYLPPPVRIGAKLSRFRSSDVESLIERGTAGREAGGDA